MITNFKARLKDRKPLIGTLISWPFPETADIAADAGFDWLFLDWEHGHHDPRSLQQVVQTAGDRCACIVRVPDNYRVWISKALDTGAAGLIMPHCDDVEDTQKAVRSAKYPPQGIRSIGVARAQGYGHDVKRSVDDDNESTVFVAQIEHIEGVRDIEAIAAVPGVDAIFIGPFDLSASMGKPGRISDGEVQDAIKRVRETGLGRGLPIGIFAPDAAAAEKALSEGYSLICLGTDAMLFAGALRQAVKDLKS